MCVSLADEEGEHHSELPAEGPGGPQEGLQRAQAGSNISCALINTFHCFNVEAV